MNWEAILSGIWAAANSPAGVTFVAAVFFWALNKVYASKPAWKKYEGTIVHAIKTVEKQIPDGVGNPSLRKFDAALRYVLEVIQTKEHRTLSKKERTEIAEGISLKHDELEAKGTLKKTAGPDLK